jgi:5-methylcytosine-specific restriction endonuclease McrA
VHHIKDIDDDPTLENALNYDNLMSLCKSCHSTITGHKEKPVWKPFNLKKFLLKEI